MIQFYFLSVFLNVAGGLALSESAIPRRAGSFEGVREFLRGRTVRIVIGILAAVTGSFKLLSAIRGDIPIVGDFVPASVGMLLGASLLREAYLSAEPEGGAGDAASAGQAAGGSAAAAAGPGGRALGLLLTRNRAAIGIAGIISGAAHFLFPTVLFL